MDLHFSHLLILLSGIDWMKNGQASRLVTIPSGTVKLPKDYKVYQQQQKEGYGKAWQDCDRLFIKEEGSPMHPDTPYQWFEKFLVRNNLPPITVHQLLHTNVSIMIYQGADTVSIAAEKGHNPYTMLNTYTHVIRKAYTEGATKMDEMFYKGLMTKPTDLVYNQI